MATLAKASIIVTIVHTLHSKNTVVNFIMCRTVNASDAFNFYLPGGQKIQTCVKGGS